MLAYSTVSQLGFMMLALGLGGWVAGLFHLITHAFFKSLLFLCSGSVIHAVHTNDMRQMGGLRKKMPITAYTMLVGCLAIAGVGVPFLPASAASTRRTRSSSRRSAIGTTTGPTASRGLLFVVPVFSAALTAFYMFRLWYMTFAGEPRDHHRYDHAHESPRVMTGAARAAGGVRHLCRLVTSRSCARRRSRISASRICSSRPGRSARSATKPGVFLSQTC